MAEPLKDSFGPDIPHRIAEMISAVHPPFPVDPFLEDALAGYEELGLTDRGHRIARALAAHLPADFPTAAAILTASLGPPIAGDELIGVGMAPFLYLPHVFYVAEHGLGHWGTAMEFQYQLTQRFTCEYSIRAYLGSEPGGTLAKLRQWSSDPNPHVRRLVSEGTRPRLPWAPRLQMFIADPKPVVELLELLKDDPTAMVRRSVANNLNDIGKDHPEVLVEVCARWMRGATPERRMLIRHALRSAVKRGEPGALKLLGYGSTQAAEISKVTIEPHEVTIGDRVKISFAVANRSQTAVAFNVDLRVSFVKANGKPSPKTFKIKAVDLGPGEQVELSKTISLAQHTTRTHFPGEHRAEALVNGTLYPLGSFNLRRRVRS